MYKDYELCAEAAEWDRYDNISEYQTQICYCSGGCGKPLIGPAYGGSGYIEGKRIDNAAHCKDCLEISLWEKEIRKQFQAALDAEKEKLRQNPGVKPIMTISFS
jgi:hypothetical protein